MTLQDATIEYRSTGKMATTRTALNTAPAEPSADMPEAIATAYQWHNGEDTAMYSFASNGGTLSDPGQQGQLQSEVEECIAWVSTNAGDIDAGKYPNYADDQALAEQNGISTAQEITSHLENLKDAAQTVEITKQASARTAADGEFNPTSSQKVLKDYLENSVDLQELRDSIETNLDTKSQVGEVDPDMAWRMWLYFVDTGAKAYADEFGGIWFAKFPNAVREALAKEIAADPGQSAELPEEMPVTPQTSVPKEDSTPITSSTDKESKILVSEDVFKRAMREAGDLVNQLHGSNSPEEGKATKILDAMEKFSAESGGNLEFVLDDEDSPSTASWAQTLIRSLNNLKNEINGRVQTLPHGHPEPITSIDPEQKLVAAAVKNADVAGNTIRAIVTYVRTNRDRLRDILRDQGAVAVAQDLAANPGGQFAGKLAPIVISWLKGNGNESAMVGGVENIVSRTGSTDENDAEVVTSSMLAAEGFHPQAVVASEGRVLVYGIKVNAHTVKVASRLANEYGLKLKFAGDFAPEGEQPATYPEPKQDYPEEIIQEGESFPIVTPEQAAKVSSLDDDSKEIQVQGFGILSVGGLKRKIQSYLTEINRFIEGGQWSNALYMLEGNGVLPAMAKALRTESKVEVTSGLTIAASDEGDDTEGQCPSCGGPSTELGNLGDRKHFRCRNCGQEHSKTASADEGAVYEPLADTEEHSHAYNHSASTKTAADDNLTALLNELKASLAGVRDLSDMAVARARLSENAELIRSTERINTKVFEALLASRGTKEEVQGFGDSPDPDNASREDRAFGIVAGLHLAADEAPNALMHNAVDTKSDAIAYIHDNADRFEDFTVQQLRDGLSEGGFSDQVADAAVTGLLGSDALLALGSPVADFL